MDKYIGTKVVNAKPMNRLEYNYIRGWEVPADEDPADDGYLVEYVDGGKANHPDFDGYISWSPKDVFDRAYKRIEVNVDKREDALPTKVNLTDMMAKVVRTEYVQLSDGKTTLCVLHLRNGFTIVGKSACVDPANFNVALGEKYSYEDAINQLWPLEGYLLAERRYQSQVKGNP